MHFVLGEDLVEVFILLRNRWRAGLSDFMDSGEIFKETSDFIEVQNIDFIVGVNFGCKMYLQRDTWRFLFQEMMRITFSSDPLGDSNLRLRGKSFRGFRLLDI